VPEGRVTADVAQDIAVGNGVIAIRKIEFDDGAWKVEGRDREGRRVEMKIHPTTGEILRLERFY
jgi:Peptidase propeptide and YPEB domain